MTWVFDSIDWRHGILIQQRVEMPHDNLIDNFKIRPYTQKIVMRLHADDFPADTLRDMSELTEWVDQNLAPNLESGIFYIQSWGWYTAYYRHKKQGSQNRVWRHRREEKGLFKRKRYGIVALGKFELLDGRCTRFFSKRGRSKHPPHTMKPDYPLWLLFKGGLKTL